MGVMTYSLDIGCVILAVGLIILYFNNRHLEYELLHVEKETNQLKVLLEGYHETCDDEVVSAYRRIPATHVIAHNQHELYGLDVELNVTFIVLHDTSNPHRQQWLAKQVDSIVQSFPKAKILCASYGPEKTKTVPRVHVVWHFEHKAQSLNKAMLEVKTVYFLVLEPGSYIDNKGSDNSVVWLHHAMVTTPGFDIIGGSMLLSNQELVIPCYSIRLCNWTMIQKYEYARSFGEVIICDEVGHSFMAHTNIINKFKGPPFDQTLDAFMFTDFFLRAKHAGLTVANRPEVMFLQLWSQDEHKQSDTQLIDSALPFAQKHALLRFKNPDKKIISVCDASDRSVCSVENLVEKWKFPKWYESGMFAYPCVIEQQIRTLEMIAKQLRKANIPFALRGETLYGSIMTKSILPWGHLEAIYLWVFQSGSRVKNFAGAHKHSITFSKNVAMLGVKVEGFPQETKVELLLSPDQPRLTKILLNGKLYPIMSDPVKELIGLYGDDYLEGLDKSKEPFTCKIQGHHACLPDMARRGSDTHKELYCEI